jgi:Putative transmembrane protein (Alph_Pro_TM)
MRLLKALIPLLCLVSPLPAAGLDVKVTPQVVQMGTFYNGTRVKIEGLCERGTKPVIVIRGSEVKQVFNVKGRAGPIWVTTGKVSISGVPSVYVSMSPQPVSDFLKPAVIEKYQLDLAALKKQIKIQPPGTNQEIIGVNYLKLKNKEKSYRVINDALKMGAPGTAGVPYSVDLDWSKKAPPGNYEVVVYECRNGSVVKEFHTTLEVARVGFPAFMASLAQTHAELYGLLAVVVALLAGLGVDFAVASLHREKKHTHAPESAQALPTHSEHSPIPPVKGV